MADITTSDLNQKNKVISFWVFEKRRIKQLKNFIFGVKNNDSNEISLYTLVYQTYKSMNKNCKNIYHKIIFINIVIAILYGLYPFTNMLLYGSLPELVTGSKIGILTFIFFMVLRFVQDNTSAVLRKFETFNSSKLKDLYKRYSRTVEYKEILSKPRSFFVINSHMTLFSFMREIRELKLNNLSSFYRLLHGVVAIIACTVSVMCVSPYLFFLFLVVAIFNVESMLYIEDIKRKNFYKASVLSSHISKRDNDILLNSPLVQEALSSEKESGRIFYRGKYIEGIYNKIRFIDLRNEFTLQGVVNFLSTAIIVYFIIYDIINTKDIGRFALISSATGQFRFNFEDLSKSYTQISSNRNKIVDLEKKLELPKALERKIGNDILQRIDDTITINNAEFSYPKIKDITMFGEEKIERGAIVINGISTKIKKGGITAIVGASGQGKSTLLSLIRHDYDLNSGSIKLGDKDITDLSDDVINKQIAFIEQRVQFFDNTLLYNLKYFNEQATDEEVKKALDSAGLIEDISRFKDGLYHRVGQQGRALSGGQRQRLALARIFLTDRPIMILDEPTTGLDQVLSFKVMNTLKEKAKNKTVLLVTHNPTEIALADRVIVIKNGQIENDGTPLELVQNSPFIKACLTKQDIISKQKLFSKIA